MENSVNTNNDDLFKLWAKTKADVPETRYPLIYHLLDTISVTKLLWKYSFQQDLRDFLSAQLGIKNDEAMRWISYWAGLHDIGKASPAFQKKCITAKKELEELGFIFINEENNHGEVSSLLLKTFLKEKIDPLLANHIAITVGGHHGVFPRAEQVNSIGSDIGKGTKWKEVQRQVFDTVTQLCKIDTIPSLNKIPPPSFFMILAGLTSVADWIASNEDYFSYDVKYPLDEHIQYADRQAEKAMEALHWCEWEPAKENISFQNIFSFPIIRPLQESIINISDELKNKPGLVIIEAPMGEGKTEAAMYLSDIWNTNLKQRGCYFALPTMATSNQMFGRIKNYVVKRYPEKTTNLMLMHGHASLSAEFESMSQDSKYEISEIRSDKGYDGAAGGVIASEWFTHRKRGLLAPFGVGTIDQILLAVLQTKHVFVRLFGLSGKTVIIDEVHAYDSYMSTLLERLLEWLAALNTSVVLLSATLPKNRKDALLKAYIKGLTQKNEDIINYVSDIKYPRISWTDGEDIKAQHIDTSIESSKIAGLEYIDGKLPEDNEEFLLGKKLQEALSDGGCAAVICNTVDKAQQVYTSLKKYFPNIAGDGFSELDLLHARFPYGERKLREERTLIRYGKENAEIKCDDGIERAVNRPHRGILVSTQIIEQSLDLDFDLMVSEMAPVDLLLQRAGRMHRHKRNNRPKKLDRPTLWICKPESNSDIPSFGNGTEAVYDAHILLRSWLAIKDKNEIIIPDEIEELIEKVYDENLKCPESECKAVQNTWNMTKQGLKQKIESSKKEAEERQIKWSGFSGQLSHITYDPREEDNPDIHPAFQALTRLAEPSVNIICLFGNKGHAFLDQSLTKSINTLSKPDNYEIVQLLKQTTSLSKKVLVRAILNNETFSIPQIWREIPVLRHHYILWFDENGKYNIDNYAIRLDKELGLVINKC
jgi:CRISPR-associated endonuclease/helicase Cas3